MARSNADPNERDHALVVLAGDNERLTNRLNNMVVILAGRQGIPVRADDLMSVAYWPNERAAQAWIEAHPKAKTPYIVKLTEWKEQAR